MLAPFFISGILITQKNDPMPRPSSGYSLSSVFQRCWFPMAAIPRDVGDHGDFLSLR
jgi:hypothetical protein